MQSPEFLVSSILSFQAVPIRVAKLNFSSALGFGPAYSNLGEFISF